MDVNNSIISEKDRSSILNHVINCANAALQNEDAFQQAMLGLATELRLVFVSEFCSIGIVTDGYVEDCIRSYKEFEDEKLSKQQEESLKSVKRVSVDDDSFVVCLALKSDEDIFFFQNSDQYNNYEDYQTILTSGHVINSYVIPLRDKGKKNFGYIQFINSEKNIDYQRDISPYSDALLGLVQFIINNNKNRQELIHKSNLLKDADFYNKMQEKRDNVDELLDSIMNYFSQEFNAAIVSFRIPLLNGYNKEPLFYLRSFFVHPSIDCYQRSNLIKFYNTKRYVRSKDQMYIDDGLRCDLKGTIFKNISYTDFSQYGLKLNNNSIIIPIFRDFDKKCIDPQRIDSDYCKKDEHRYCKYRFKRLYGVFRIRISKTDLTNNYVNYHFDLEETKNRLTYLSKQISLLLNSIVDKQVNESLQTFQNELKNNSFIKIQEFDKQCVEIIKNADHAKVCSIYRYNDRTRQLSLRATTADTMQFVINGKAIYFQTSKIQKSCFVSPKARNNLLTDVFSAHRSLYVFNILDTSVHQSVFIERVNRNNDRVSALAVPMIKKDGTCGGVVLLLGKDAHKHSISTAYWEHDIKHVEFIVNILTRISESDTERLTFLSQLSHELLAPVSELVYDNDLTLNIAERNFDSIPKRQLVAKIRENIDRIMLFKYIINDTEFIYSSTGRSIDYNIVKQEKPQTILLDAIRSLEKEAMSKGLTIRLFIKEMPPLYFDRERMMQVFLILLKNAIRHADKYTEISISYNKRDDDFHEISFADDGIGVQEDERETIFELFYRGKEAKEKIPWGTGMGLYIVRDIMRAHGGDCFVRRLQKPTEFVIALPNIKDNQ